MAKRDEEAAVETVTVDRLNRSVDNLYMDTPTESWSCRQAYGVMSVGGESTVEEVKSCRVLLKIAKESTMKGEGTAGRKKK